MVRLEYSFSSEPERGTAIGFKSFIKIGMSCWE